MAGIRHSKVSAKADGGDASLVLPSDWNDDHEGIAIVRKTANEDVTSSTTLQNDNHLIFAIAASEVWVVEYALKVAGSEGGIKVAIAAPAGATVSASGIGPTDTTTNVLDTNVKFLDIGAGSGTFGTAGAVDGSLMVRATIINSVTAGNVTLQWAQSVSDTDLTRVSANSYLIAHRVA